MRRRVGDGPAPGGGHSLGGGRERHTAHGRTMGRMMLRAARPAAVLAVAALLAAGCSGGGDG
ncbi:hypothetical protein C6N75_27330, partial [Streptomyces solincola]